MEQNIVESDNTVDGTTNQHRSLFNRLFGEVKEGSLRLVVLAMILNGTTSTFFWYPSFLKVYGVVPGLLLIFLMVGLNYFSCCVIFEASVKYHEDNYLNLLDKAIGKTAYKIGIFTYFMDYFATFVVGLILICNIFQYLLYYWGFFTDEMRENLMHLDFLPYHPVVFKTRAIFMFCAFLIAVPLLLKNHLSGIKYIFLYYVFSFSGIIVYFFFDLNEFRNHYQEKGVYSISLFKPFEMSSFKYTLIFLASFYIQPNLLTTKEDLLNPTPMRLKKTLNYSHLFFLFFATVFGFYGYYCLGDNFTNSIFMLRQSFAGKRFEGLYRFMLLWGAFNGLTYLSFFNLSMKRYINSITKTPKNQIVVSLLPYFCAAFLAFAYPNIEEVFGLNAILVILVNGFIFPTFMKRSMDLKEGKGLWRIVWWDFQVVLYFLIGGISLYQILIADELN